MTDLVTQRNIGALIALVPAIPPESSSGGTINGTALDRFAHGLPNSCVLHQMVGAISGAPTATSVQTKLQHSQDDVTWSDFQINGTTQATAALAVANTDGSLGIDLLAEDIVKGNPLGGGSDCLDKTSMIAAVNRIAKCGV